MIVEYFWGRIYKSLKIYLNSCCKTVVIEFG